MKMVPINEATAAQLRAYATNTLNLEVKPTATRDSVIAKMKAVGNVPDAIPDHIETKRVQTIAPATTSPVGPYDDEHPSENFDLGHDENAGPPRVVAGQEFCVPGLIVGTKKWERAHCEVFIPKVSGVGGSDPVSVSVNGRAMRIERGIPQRIRAPYLECLLLAVAAHVRLDKDFRIEEVTDINRHSVSVRKMVGAA